MMYLNVYASGMTGVILFLDKALTLFEESA